jgi:tRNA-binding EMAP/Myf-like protein
MIRGVESQGMILAGEDSNGLEVINITKLANGSEIR